MISVFNNYTFIFFLKGILKFGGSHPSNVFAYFNRNTCCYERGKCRNNNKSNSLGGFILISFEMKGSEKKVQIKI